MKFDFKNGLIWVSINLEYEGKDKKIENCILDTGSATTALDIDLVEFNYRKSSTVKRLIGIGGGTQEVISQQVEKITIDQIPIPESTFRRYLRTSSSSCLIPSASQCLMSV